MPVNLNLLPPELAVSKNLGNALKTLRALGVIAIAVFLISAIGLGVFFVVSTISLNTLNTSVNQLESQVSAQEASEQQLIILKDRIAKITKAKDSPSAVKTITNVDALLSGLSADSSITQFNADPLRAEMTINFKSNSDLTAFVRSVSATKLFGSIDLSSFGFSPVAGYLVGINLSLK